MPDDARPESVRATRARITCTPSRGRNVIVFAGPCLPRHPDPRWRRLLSRVDVRPPARRGDVLMALADRPRTILLLDGYYYTVPSVTHKELLRALEAGVRVIGAASMGALRAAELERFGMIGVGRIFDLFRTGALDGDDEVAILHAPHELGYVPTTIALVELRLAVDRLVSDGWVEARAGARFIDLIKRKSFGNRDPGLVLTAARATLHRQAVERLERMLQNERVKEADARLALELALGPVPRASAQASARSETAFLHRFKEQTLRAPGDRRAVAGSTVLRCWFLTQLFHPDAPRFVRLLRLRYLAFSEGTYAGLRVAPRRLAWIARALRGIHEREFGATWLPDVEYEDEARIQALADEASDAFGGLEAICGRLARRLGVSVRDPEGALLRFLQGQPDALPSWWQARAFTFSGAVGAARDLCCEAEAVQCCSRRFFRGASVSWQCLMEVAASIWSCTPSAVIEEAASRGLFVAPGASEGLRDALELVAAAERLPIPVNAYPRAKLRLQQAVLRPFEAPETRAHQRVGDRRPVRETADRAAAFASHTRRPTWCSRTLFSVCQTGMPDGTPESERMRMPSQVVGFAEAAMDPRTSPRRDDQRDRRRSDAW